MMVASWSMSWFHDPKGNNIPSCNKDYSEKQKETERENKLY